MDPHVPEPVTWALSPVCTCLHLMRRSFQSVHASLPSFLTLSPGYLMSPVTVSHPFSIFLLGFIPHTIHRAGLISPVGDPPLSPYRLKTVSSRLTTVLCLPLCLQPSLASRTQFPHTHRPHSRAEDSPDSLLGLLLIL